jgi:hypothetical protein
MLCFKAITWVFGLGQDSRPIFKANFESNI